MNSMHHYILNGTPVQLRTTTELTRRTWSEQKERKLFNELYIKNQHQGPKFSGNISMDLSFYFNKKEDYNRYSLVALIRFIEAIANDVLLDKNCTVTSITTKRCLDPYARTELIIVKE